LAYIKVVLELYREKRERNLHTLSIYVTNVQQQQVRYNIYGYYIREYRRSYNVSYRSRLEHIQRCEKCLSCLFVCGAAAAAGL
jgi:hypothetical protein